MNLYGTGNGPKRAEVTIQLVTVPHSQGWAPGIQWLVAWPSGPGPAIALGESLEFDDCGMMAEADAWATYADDMHCRDIVASDADWTEPSWWPKKRSKKGRP